MSKTPPSGNKSYNVHGNTTQNDCHREEKKKSRWEKKYQVHFSFLFSAFFGAVDVYRCCCCCCWCWTGSPGVKQQQSQSCVSNSLSSSLISNTCRRGDRAVMNDCSWSAALTAHGTRSWSVLMTGSGAFLPRDHEDQTWVQ